MLIFHAFLNGNRICVRNQHFANLWLKYRKWSANRNFRANLFDKKCSSFKEQSSARRLKLGHIRFHLNIRNYATHIAHPKTTKLKINKVFSIYHLEESDGLKEVDNWDIFKRLRANTKDAYSHTHDWERHFGELKYLHSNCLRVPFIDTTKVTI